jgi:acyl carrier protein
MQFKNLKKLKFIIFKKFGIINNNIKLNSRIFHEIIQDSLEYLEFILLLEKAFNIEILDSHNLKNKTMKELISFINLSQKKLRNGI